MRAGSHVRKALAPHVTRLELLIPDLYLANVKAFREPAIEADIERIDIVPTPS